MLLYEVSLVVVLLMSCTLPGMLYNHCCSRFILYILLLLRQDVLAFLVIFGSLQKQTLRYFFIEKNEKNMLANKSCFTILHAASVHEDRDVSCSITSLSHPGSQDGREAAGDVVSPSESAGYSPADCKQSQ